MDKITAEQVAEALTAGDNDYDDSLDAYTHVSADGPIVRIRLERDGEPARQFTATVTPGAEPPSVHSERLAIAYPTSPGEPDDVSVPGWCRTNPAADAAVRESFAQETTLGAHLVRLVTRVYPVEETA